MDIRTIITAVFLGIGCFFIIVTSIGIVRFPDFYSRLHPAGKTDTVGQALVLIGLMIYEGKVTSSVRRDPGARHHIEGWSAASEIPAPLPAAHECP